MTKRHSHIGAVYVILRKEDGSFPMLLRQNTGYKDGEYVVPSGHVEKDEHFLQAAVRELKEEVGVDAKETDLNLVHVAHRLVNDSKEDRIDMLFELKNWQGEVTNAEPEKCVQIDWFTEENLPSNTYDYLKVMVRNTRNGENYSEF